MQFNTELLTKNIAGVYFNNLKRPFTLEIRKSLESLMFMIEADPGWTDVRHVAYFLATIAYETRWTFQPIKEFRAKPGNPVYDIQNRYWPSGYYGRGFIQLTWRSNYEKFTRILGINLLANPDLAYQPAISYKIAAIGMQKGIFTGKKLSDYLNAGTSDYIGARKVVNGTDQDKFIASLARLFEKSLVSSKTDAIKEPVQIKVNEDVRIVTADDVSITGSDIAVTTNTPSTVSPSQAPEIPRDTVDIVRSVPAKVSGLKTWKAALLGVLSSIGTGLAAIWTWLNERIANPGNFKYLLLFIAVLLLISSAFVIAHMFTRISLLIAREKLANERIIKEMELRADPNKYSVRAE